MIPQQTLESYPLFGDNATKVTPDDAKRAAGFQQSDVLPAEWMNWAWYKNSKGISDLNEGISSIEAELIAVLTAAGITPSEATENQVITAINAIQNKVITIATNTSVTPTGHIRYVISDNITLTLGSSGVSAGTEVSILFVTAGSVTYKAITEETVTDVINASRLLKYVFTGTAWLCSSAPEIGSTEYQYPEQDEPASIYGGQWEDISEHYAGLFPRIAGGNAETFNNQQACSVGGTSVVFSSSDHGITTSSLLIDPNTWEQRAVTAVSGTTVTIESAFSDSSSITNVLVVQNEGLPNIKGKVTALLTNISSSTTSGAVNVGLFAGGSEALLPGDNMTTKIGYNSSTIIYGTNTTVKSSTFITLNASNSSAIYGGSSHNTPINLTIKIWKRIN